MNIYYLIPLVIIIFSGICIYNMYKKNEINDDFLLNEILEKLSIKLKSLKSKEGIIQLNKLEEKISEVKNVLGASFNSNEITFIQYMGIVDEVYMSLIDNLRKYYLIKKSIESIDSEYILKKIKEGEWHNDDEKYTLLRRFEIEKKHISDANYLLYENDKALLKLIFLAFEVTTLNIQYSHRVGLAQKNLLSLSKKIHCGSYV